MHAMDTTTGLALECIITIPHYAPLFATSCAPRLNQHAHTLEQQVASPELLGCIIYDSKLHLTTCLQTASLIFHRETHHLVPANITPSRISPVLASMKYVDPISCPKDAEETIDGRHAPFSCPKDAEDTIDGC